MPAEDVQNHLGHRNIANTMTYAKITNKRREGRRRSHAGLQVMMVVARHRMRNSP